MPGDFFTSIIFLSVQNFASLFEQSWLNREFATLEPYFVHEAFRKRVEKELEEFRSLTLPDDYSAEKKKKPAKSGNVDHGG